MKPFHVAAIAAAVLAAACTPAANTSKAPEVTDKLYAVTPPSITVKAGILTGELTEMKITERVEAGSGNVETPPRLTGKLVLKNVSADQAVRLIGGNVVYVDTQGKVIPLEENRTAPSIKVSGYGAPDRLDPGQESKQDVEAEFPAAALQAKRLKEIRLDLQYLPSAYRQESLRFGVAVGQ